MAQPGCLAIATGGSLVGKRETHFAHTDPEGGGASARHTRGTRGGSSQMVVEAPACRAMRGEGRVLARRVASLR